MAVYEGPLGMLLPTDDRHRMLYPITDETLPLFPTPGVAASNWWSAFDRPYQDADGNFWLVKPGETQWGRIRGGHCYCVKEKSMRDLKSWWRFYDQGNEGACVGFGTCRALTLVNRARYDGFSLYHEAQRIDEWPGEDYDGTSTRAGLDVARKEGAWRVRAGKITGPFAKDGILENRWGATMEDVAAALNPADSGLAILNRGWIMIANSWGDQFPFEARMDLETADRLWFREDGEYGIITDLR